MTKSRSVLSLFACVLFVVFSASLTGFGQSSKPPATSVKVDPVDYEVQLYLLLAANEADEKANMPQSLDPVIRQLRSSLSFSHYRLAATFVNRVKDGGTVESRGLVPSNLFTPANTTPVPQAVYEFTLTKIKADDDLKHIDINRFRFGLQIPVITGMTRAEGNVQAFPQINYQPATISTEINFREGTPTVVGTMNTSRSDQILVLIVTVKRAQ
jgi:hypothetical protein